MRDRATRLRRLIGRRGTALLFFALLDLVYARGLLWSSESARDLPSFRFLATLLPLWVWGVLWAGVGIVCLVFAFASHDRIGFAAAMGLKVLWGALFLAGGALAGLDRGVEAGAVWLTFAAFVGVISTWPEPGKELAWTRPSSS